MNRFGDATTQRYLALISQASLDGADPGRPGATERSELMIAGAYTYHLAFSRSRVAGAGVKMPRHFLRYRCSEPGMIQIGRILHDSRDLVRHLPEEYRSATEKLGNNE